MTDLDERVAVLEERLDKHLKDASEIIRRIDTVDTKVDIVISDLNKYNWLARGVMMALAFVGLATGWVIDKAHFIRGLFR